MINVCNIFRFLNTSYRFRKTSQPKKNVSVSSHLLYLNLTFYCSVKIYTVQTMTFSFKIDNAHIFIIIIYCYYYYHCYCYYFVGLGYFLKAQSSKKKKWFGLENHLNYKTSILECRKQWNHWQNIPLCSFIFNLLELVSGITLTVRKHLL